tara:strand:+ start:2358 stop:2909 length:552 start_codon:yes stop_codon:yes gene_type:complete
MKIKKIHHVAYRCVDANETVEFYYNLLGMELLLVFAEDKVPSTKEEHPYMHIFLDAGMGNVLAFFELPNSPKIGRDENTPFWVQHIALEVEDMKGLMETKLKLESMGLEVIGPVDHSLFKSIYFTDPSGHRVELTCNINIPQSEMEKLKSLAPIMLNEWNRTKKPPKQNAWLHEKEFRRYNNE